MIKAGEAVDQQMEALRPHLSKGDIMIDAGNANFRDTIARFDRLKNTDPTFIGMGVAAQAGGRNKSGNGEDLRQHVVRYGGI
jgi:6-phosphogluconate dehydrogenase